MSIESQAMFWFRNVCDTPEYLKNIISDDNLLEGLNEFGILLKKIYSDYKSYEVSTVERIKTKIGIMSDDLDNYHNLTNLGLCLYYIAFVGEEKSEGDITYLQIEKSLFKKSFKHPITFYFNMLETYDFHFKYYKKGIEVNAYKLCDTFDVYFKSSNSLMSAMKYLVDRAAEVKVDYANQATLYLMADYESILLGKSTKRNALDPFKTSIGNTAGSKKELWIELVDKIQNKLELDHNISLNTYVFPHWIVKFLKKKKTMCTFQIYCDYINIRLPLSYDVAKDVISRKTDLPQSIQDCIQNFNCINCGKCVNQSNIEIFQGIHLCKLNYSNFVTEDSRCICVSIQSKEEATAIYDILKSLVMEKC